MSSVTLTIYFRPVSFYTRALRPALFALNAERAHDITMAALRRPLVVRALQSGPRRPADPHLGQRALGLDFAHPIGLAAGLDKQGTAIPAWAALGFAHAEIGTVTPAPQPGNPRPRLFRLPGDLAIINRFGFNSDGAAAVAGNLGAGTPPGLVRGINVGKNRDTPNERAAEDCIRAIETLHRFADYFVVNVSSPNTERLRDLQESHALRTLLEQVTTRVRELTEPGTIPVLVKISPDAEPRDLLRSVDAALEGGAAGIVATNTTIARTAITSSLAEAGGLSGAPLRPVANTICRLLFAHLGNRVPIVGVGGVFTADDAYERIRCGATLVQIYTALIYEGPAVVRAIVQGLGERLARDGFTNVREAIGVDVH
jgi:dihydroorotate dehydrogenase